MLEIIYIKRGKEKKLKGLKAQIFLDCHTGVYGEKKEFYLDKGLDFIHIKNAKFKGDLTINGKGMLILENCILDNDKLEINGGDIELYNFIFLRECQINITTASNVCLNLVPSAYFVKYNVNSNNKISVKGNSYNQELEISNFDILECNYVRDLKLSGSAHTWNIINSDITLENAPEAYKMNIWNSKIKGDVIDLESNIIDVDLKKALLEATNKICLRNYTYYKKENEDKVIVSDRILDEQSEVMYFNTKRNVDKGQPIMVRNYDVCSDNLNKLLSILVTLKNRAQSMKLNEELESARKNYEKAKAYYLEEQRKASLEIQNRTLKQILH